MVEEGEGEGEEEGEEEDEGGGQEEAVAVAAVLAEVAPMCATAEVAPGDGR